MNVVTVRDLRNRGGEVLNRVSNGEALIVTRDGAEVAELRPLRRPSVTVADLIARRAALPPIDVVSFKRDIDSVLDAGL
ncbi:MAG: type II toxin-antitoxin system prevent-host-death family antitoxin [Actinomycetota bacterium]